MGGKEGWSISFLGPSLLGQCSEEALYYLPEATVPARGPLRALAAAMVLSLSLSLWILFFLPFT